MPVLGRHRGEGDIEAAVKRVGDIGELPEGHVALAGFETGDVWSLDAHAASELGLREPLFERNYAERPEPDAEGVRELEEINADEGVRWVFSFLTANKRKSYCVYEASSPDAILAAARRAGLPADVIVEVERVEAALFA
jgi:Protein of unknown function (DUF4242)